MNAGYSGTPLPKKLGIKEGSAVASVGAPDHFTDLLVELPQGAVLTRNPRGTARFDVIIVFVRSEEELVKRFGRGSSLLDPFGGLWVAWPKQTSPLATDLKESHVREHGLSTGLVDNKVCAIDSDWSGLRFVVRTVNRPPKTRVR